MLYPVDCPATARVRDWSADRTPNQESTMARQTAYDTSRATAPRDALPFEIVIMGPSFRQSDRYATEGEAYAEARRIRDERARSDKVAFRTKFGYTGLYAVGSIQIQRWNPITRRWASHAQPWSRNSPNPAALTPLPRDWHGDPLPADWYADPTA